MGVAQVLLDPLKETNMGVAQALFDPLRRQKRTCLNTV